MIVPTYLPMTYNVRAENFITSLGWLFIQSGVSALKLSETITTRFCFLKLSNRFNFATQIMQRYSEEIEGALAYIVLKFQTLQFVCMTSQKSESHCKQTFTVATAMFVDTGKLGCKGFADWLL